MTYAQETAFGASGTQLPGAFRHPGFQAPIFAGLSDFPTRNFRRLPGLTTNLWVSGSLWKPGIPGFATNLWVSGFGVWILVEDGCLEARPKTRRPGALAFNCRPNLPGPA